MEKYIPQSEHIMAVPACVFEEAGGAENYELNNEHIIFGQRAVLEKTETFRQVLPIAVITHGAFVWAYKRTKKGNEASLHEQVTVAVGGHLDLEDVITKTFSESSCNSVIDIKETMANALQRELSEEVRIESGIESVTDLMTILANETETDRKHVAYVRQFEVEDTEVYAAEDHLEGKGFYLPEDLLRMHHKGEIFLETWARIICKKLIAG